MELEGAEDFELEIGPDNVDGVEYNSYYYLDYYGVNVFFCVCKTDRFRVCIYELAKKQVKVNGEICDALCKGLKPNKNPLVVKENNCPTKSKFWVQSTKEGNLLIPIPLCSTLYNEAVKAGTPYPNYGYGIATCIDQLTEKGLLRYYWERGPKKK